MQSLYGCFGQVSSLCEGIKLATGIILTLTAVFMLALYAAGTNLTGGIIKASFIAHAALADKPVSRRIGMALLPKLFGILFCQLPVVGS